MKETYPIRSALVSVFDKTGLEPLCRALQERHIAIYSTGGTASFIEKLGIPVIALESVTEFPEMMDGRVKTLHPKVFGGILARREETEDREAAKRHGIPLFDLVCVNLYPFWEHRGKTLKEQTKFIDIGGPSMIRAASKNFESVAVLSHPQDYDDFLKEFREHQGSTTKEFRFAMAAKTFRRTSEYDAMIASEWEKAPSLPQSVSLTPQIHLRYGENPHQSAAWAGPTPTPWKVLQGKELSYNNLLDSEAALRIVGEFAKPAVSIVKHNNPCGVASFEAPVRDVFAMALTTDSKSAFGGIVAVNRPVDENAAEAMAAIFLEVVIAPSFSPKAIEIFSKKKNLRLIEWITPQFQPYEIRAALGGWLIQESDSCREPQELKVVTETKVPADGIEDLKFAWLVCKHVRSNAIVIAKNGVTLGIGAGQMSRVDAVTIALQKGAALGLQSAVLASDAFFPFRDNIDLLKGTGIRAVIQPGGSQRDPEVIQACNEHQIAMVFTGQRHFRH